MSMKSSNIWKFYSLKNVNNLLKNFISTRSTHFRRTICSAKCVLAGIYCKSHEETPDGRHLRLMNVNFHFCNFFNLNKILLLFMFIIYMTITSFQTHSIVPISWTCTNSRTN